MYSKKEYDEKIDVDKNFCSYNNKYDRATVRLTD
jgi:hypothetical protein